MIIVYIFAIMLTGFLVVYITSMEMENKRRKLNPIPKMANHDKNIKDIKAIYSHEMYKITREN